jgi:pyrimidine-specific ribonucleoside hydrolase
VRLWIDTDVGDNPDDAVALRCAARHPGVELVGVSTTGGRGAWRASLAAELVDAPVVRGDDPARLLAVFRASRPQAVVAIGPLTTVAALGTWGIDLPPTTVMGGALVPTAHRGRIQPVEHNFASDPGAAAVVLARQSVTLVPLDTTVAMHLRDDQLDELVCRDPRLAPEVTRWRASRADPVVLHDPLALLVAVDDPVVGPVTTRVTRRLAVDPRDGRVRATSDGREHSVVVTIDATTAVDRVLDVLG